MVKIQAFSILDVDAMFFHSALNNLGIAKKNKITNDAITKELESITWLRDYEMWDLGDEIDISFEKEQVDYVKGLKSEKNTASGNFLQSAASVHIFCVAALEAYINKIAQQLIKGKHFQHFEKLPIEGKWLFLPQLLGKPSFDPGEQPFQNFSKLIKLRNKLVHHKGKKIPVNFPHDSIEAYESLALSVGEIEKSVDSTIKMIKKLSELFNNETPNWIEDTNHKYLRMEFDMT